MFNRLQAIRAAIFGFAFDALIMLISILLSYIIHNYASNFEVIVVYSCIILTIITLCITWATLKPYIIYGGLHSIVWFIAVLLVAAFSSLLPLALGLIVSIFLFAQLDQIMLFLHNLKRPRILFDNAMPKQSRYEPGTPLDTSNYYQEGYQPQNVSQDNEQTLFYPQSADFEERAQLQYPEM